MKTPVVSVLLPFHNPGAFFKSAVESVINQHGIQFELILVNNNSTDESSEQAEYFAANYPFVKLVHENRQGIAFALNTGLQHCSGKYVARMDADDVSLPGRLLNQAKFLDENPEFGLISGLIRLTGEITENTGMRDYIRRINLLISPQEMYNFRFIDAPFAHPSVMFRKSLIKKHGEYSHENVPEDYELWLRWYSAGIIMGKLPLEILEWRDHEKRLSRVHQNYSRIAFDKVRLHYLAAWVKEEKSALTPIYVWGGGKLSRRKVLELQNYGLKIEGFIDVDVTRKIKGFRVIHFSEIPPPDEIFIISMVTNRGKYEEIANFLLNKGYLLNQHFIISG